MTDKELLSALSDMLDTKLTPCLLYTSRCV